MVNEINGMLNTPQCWWDRRSSRTVLVALVLSPTILAGRQNSISLGNQRLGDIFEITQGPCKLPSCSNSS